MSNALRTVLLMTALTLLLVLLGGAAGGTSGAVMAFVFASVMNFATYFFGDRLVLRRYGGAEVGPDDGSRLYSIVAELATQAGLPMPRVLVIPDKAPNAFATGRSPSHATVAATEGLLDILTEEELAGVMAHELAHVQNRDILTGTIAATLAGAITMVSQAGRYQGTRRGGNPLLTMLAAIGAPFAAMFLRSSVSRTREFEADADGASLSGRPEALANALLKIQSVARRVPFASGIPGHAHLMILNPFTGGLGQLFSTHPPTEERVRRLRESAAATSTR